MNKEVSIKKKNRKRNAIIFSILTLMICVIGGTYAYFALTASNNSISGAVGGASLELSVNKMFPSSEHDEKNMIPQLYATLDEAISDKHSCIDGNGNVICQVYQATVTNLGSTSSVLKGTITFEGLDANEDGVSDIPNLKWMRINDSRTLGSYDSNTATLDEAIFEENKTFAANQTETYYFVIWIDETGEIQEDIGDFRAVIEFDSITGGLTSTVRPLLTTYIDELYNDGSDITSVHIADNPDKQEVHLNPNQGLMKVDQGSTYGVEYRYYGASPNNYVKYNNELWRIMSSSKVFFSESDTTGEQRIRLIRAASIGKYSWDYGTNGSDYDNNWSNATLNTMLNGIYYNSGSGICQIEKTEKESEEGDFYFEITERACDYSTGNVKGLSETARNLISDAVWYLGGIDSADSWANEFYTMERGTMVSSEDLPIRWTGKIGMMYPSDYMYGTDLSVCKSATGYEYWLCKDDNWLYNNDSQWVLTGFKNNGDIANLVDERGAISEEGLYVDNIIEVRPVVVLNSNVRVMGGDGSVDRPYTLGVRRSS